VLINVEDFDKSLENHELMIFSLVLGVDESSLIYSKFTYTAVTWNSSADKDTATNVESKTDSRPHRGL
jgi:hypothetical protein